MLNLKERTKEKWTLFLRSGTKIAQLLDLKSCFSETESRSNMVLWPLHLIIKINSRRDKRIGNVLEMLFSYYVYCSTWSWILTAVLWSSSAEPGLWRRVSSRSWPCRGSWDLQTGRPPHGGRQADRPASREVHAYWQSIWEKGKS